MAKRSAASLQPAQSKQVAGRKKQKAQPSVAPVTSIGDPLGGYAAVQDLQWAKGVLDKELQALPDAQDVAGIGAYDPVEYRSQMKSLKVYECTRTINAIPHLRFVHRRIPPNQGDIRKLSETNFQAGRKPDGAIIWECKPVADTVLVRLQATY